MEGWQKGAEAVLKMSGAGKENYFRAFPERKEWFQANYPEHFGRSVAAASTSLKKVTKAKIKKQRLAAIRQAAEKRDQSVLTPERRLMAQRRREGGEGLAGGMDTVADIKKSIAAGMPIRSGGIGSLFELMDPLFNTPPPGTVKPKPSKITKKEDGYYVGDQGPFPTQKDAEAAAGQKSTGVTPSDVSQKAAEKISGTFADIENLGLKGWLEKQGWKGRSWPDASSSKGWGRELGMTDAQGNVLGKMNDTGEFLGSDQQKELLMTPPAGSGYQTDAQGKKTMMRRLPFSANPPVGQDSTGMYYENTVNENNLEECSPMAMEDGKNKWDYAETWAKNPIKKGSTSSEADDEPGEYDYEGDMAKSQLRSIMHNSKMLHDMLEDNTNLPEWVQSKLTLAEDYILTAANYMRGEMERMDEEVEQVEEGAGATRKVNPMDDLVKKSMLPDKSVIPAGKGFGDDLKKQKIKQKVGKAIQKKRMARPTDNPSENEMIPKSMLPDVPGYPAGYQMEEQVIAEERPMEQPVEQPAEQPLEQVNAQEITNPFVAAGSKFLTRTSARLVYGDKND